MQRLITIVACLFRWKTVSLFWSQSKAIKTGLEFCHVHQSLKAAEISTSFTRTTTIAQILLKARSISSNLRQWWKHRKDGNSLTGDRLRFISNIQQHQNVQSQ